MQVIICDDEQKAVEYYERMLKDICNRHDISAGFVTYKSGDQLLFNIQNVIRDADIIFLDIGMPGTNGMVTASKLRNRGFEGEIIFLTMSRDAVYHAFDVRATNYLVKNDASAERIEEVFLKAIEDAMEKKSEYLLLTGVGEYRNVPVSEIRYFEIMQKIVTVYYGDNKFEFVSTMGKLENLLFARGFIRISRSYLVASKYIASFTYENVTMSTGEVLPVGRKYYKTLKKTVRSSLYDEQ